MNISRVLRTASLAVVLSLVSGQAAFAHGGLESTFPAAGATVTEPITEVSLTFSEPPVLEGSSISLENAAGEALVVGATQLTDATLSATVSDLPQGVITVNYRMAGDDGHVVTDSFTFTNNVAMATAVAATPEPKPSITLPAGMEDDDEEHEGSLKLILIGLIVALGFIAGWTTSKRKRLSK